MSNPFCGGIGYHLWWGCDRCDDYIRQAQEDFWENEYLPVKDAFSRAELEQVGAVIDPHATTDCFTRHTALLRGYGSHAVPSRSVMQSSQMSLVVLLREDPVAEKAPRWLSDIGFAGGSEVDTATMKFPGSGNPVRNMEKLRIWGSNDIHGMQYFASCILPNCRADEAHRRLFKPTGIRHVYNTNRAPYAVVHRLSGESRVEFHCIPCPSVLSTITAEGFEYSTREALVMVSRAHCNISVGGQETMAHFVWMKSIRHPDLPTENKGYEGVAPAASMMKTFTTGGGQMESVGYAQAVAGSRSRAVVRLRAFVFYEDPMTQSTVCCCFGHEDSSGGLMETMGKAGHYLTFGMASGGVNETALFQMSRLAHILPSSGEEQLDELFGQGVFSTKLNASDIFHTRNAGL